MPIYDAIVLGLGGVGSAALVHLAWRGAHVLGVDRFHPPHDQGSSHGQTRVTRQAYFEHPDYVPLVQESYRCWAELEQRIGQRLFHQVGLLEIGPTDGIVIPGVLRAASQHGLAVESLSSADVHTRWPMLKMPGDCAAVFEPTAGYLMVEDCVRAHLSAAKAAGARINTDCHVARWEANADQVMVYTARETFVARTLVIAAGAWSGAVLEDLNIRLTVRRKSLFWFRNERPEYKVEKGLPVYLFELPAGIFYGFPQLDSRGVKVGEHSGGATVSDPSILDRSRHLDEQQRLTSFLASHLPGVGSEVTDHTVCMYTMTDDEHFVLDRHPRHANVVFAAGLSGHGFKFTPVLGMVLADLALSGRTNLPIGFLSLDRFARLQRFGAADVH